jgi:RNA polymerase sigma-70 factor (ECF subfamily)
MSGFSTLTLPLDTAQGVLNGNSDAIADAYRILAQAVMNLATRILQDRGLAEEVVQDTFIELVEKSAGIRSTDAIPAWVRRVAVNHCLMRLRSPWHARRTQIAAEAALEGQQEDTSLDWVAGLPTMEQALSTLGEETRAVIWLHDVEGYTHKEIGALMGKTSSFSKSQLARGSERLLRWRESRDRLQMDIESPSTGIAKQHEHDHEQRIRDIGTPCAS